MSGPRVQQTPAKRTVNTERDLGILPEKRLEVRPGKNNEAAIDAGLHRGRAGLAEQERYLAKELPRSEGRDDPRGLPCFVDERLHETGLDDVKRVALVASAEEAVAGGDRGLRTGVSKRHEPARFQRTKKGYTCQEAGKLIGGSSAIVHDRVRPPGGHRRLKLERHGSAIPRRWGPSRMQAVCQ